jgi:hypothetical protein
MASMGTMPKCSLVGVYLRATFQQKKVSTQMFVAVRQDEAYRRARADCSSAALTLSLTLFMNITDFEF